MHPFRPKCSGLYSDLNHPADSTDENNPQDLITLIHRAGR